MTVYLVIYFDSRWPKEPITAAFSTEDAARLAQEYIFETNDHIISDVILDECEVHDEFNVTVV